MPVSNFFCATAKRMETGKMPALRQLWKKRVGGGAGGGAEFFEGTTFCLGDHFRKLFHIRGFATFAAIGDRGEVWAIGLQHELAERRGGNGVANILAIFERGNAGETDERIHREDALHRGGVIRETMEHAANTIGIRLKLRQRVFERVALVDDAV